jgi:hypothetical protein
MAKILLTFSCLILVLSSCSTLNKNDRTVASLTGALNTCSTAIRHFLFKSKNIVEDQKLARLTQSGSEWRWSYINKESYQVNDYGEIFYNGTRTLSNEKIIPSGHRFLITKGSHLGREGIVGNNGVRLANPKPAFGPRAEVKLGPTSTYILFPNNKQSYVFRGKKTRGYKIQLLEGGRWMHTKDGIKSTFDKNGTLIP